MDLAGSERLKETRRTDGVDQGAAVWETGNINRSLFALGKVISALAERSSGRETAVPFRESKLTQLLIDSLGGGGRTVMVACCSPRRSHADETMNTLHFAALAMQARCASAGPTSLAVPLALTQAYGGKHTRSDLLSCRADFAAPMLIHSLCGFCR